MKTKENINILPDFCYSVNNVNGDLIILKNGESGYYHAQEDGNAEDLADRLNGELGVTKPQREAMEYGSMWGWGLPAANPNAYNEDGSFREDFLAARR